MVPRKIFFFWEGNTMSWMRYMTLKSFRTLNPNWDIELYLGQDSQVTNKTWFDGSKQDFHNFKGKNYLPDVYKLDIKIITWKIPLHNNEDWNKRISPSHKSNFFKWHTLSTAGGIYSDMDILFTSPMDKFYNSIKDSDLGICCDPYFSIGFMFSSPDNRFFKEVYDNTFFSWDPSWYQTAGVMNIYNMLRSRKLMVGSNYNGLYKTLCKEWSEYIIENMSMKIVYPWNHTQMESVFHKLHFNLPDETIGIHWYAGAKISQAYNNILTDTNLTKNTFCYFARKVLS